MAATMKKNQMSKTSEARDPAKEMLLRNTVDVLRAYIECSDEIQHGVLEMAQILADPNADEDAKLAAGVTLIEALYPSYVGEELGMDIERYDKMHRDVDPEIEDTLDEQEATFASRLTKLMEQKGMTQNDLASSIGVGQPAISMMLNRCCRPQRTTVERIAEALKVRVEELWPELKRE